jgi:hypothetical protein
MATDMYVEQKILYPVPLLTQKSPSHAICKGFLTGDECETLIAIAAAKGYRYFDQSRYGEPGKVKVETCEIVPSDMESAYAKVAREAALLNQQYWQLNLTGIVDHFRVLRYGEGYWSRPHVDRDYRLPDSPKIACIVQLVDSTAFTGGVLTVAETDAIALEQGDAVFLPAHEIHTVSKVESGTRMVMAAWVHGPILR